MRSVSGYLSLPRFGQQCHSVTLKTFLWGDRRGSLRPRLYIECDSVVPSVTQADLGTRESAPSPDWLLPNRSPCPSKEESVNAKADLWSVEGLAARGQSWRHVFTTWTSSLCSRTSDRCVNTNNWTSAKKVLKNNTTQSAKLHISEMSTWKNHDEHVSSNDPYKCR